MSRLDRHVVHSRARPTRLCRSRQEVRCGAPTGFSPAVTLFSPLGPVEMIHSCCRRHRRIFDRMSRQARRERRVFISYIIKLS